MNNNGENSQMSTKSTLIEDNNKESVNKDKEKTKSFIDKIVNKISNIGRIRGIEIAVDASSNVKFITFGLFVLIGFIVIIYAILVGVVVADTVIQSANVFFIVTIISISTLVGTLAHQIRLLK